MKLVHFFVAMVVISMFLSFAYATEVDAIRETASKYSRGEAMLVDGPFYLQGNSYYVVDFMFESENKGSLVYDNASKNFTTDPDVMKKIFATKDMKTLTLWDPLFYAIGDYTKIPLAAKYETQNVRNFANFSNIDENEKQKLETFLQDYEKLALDIAECSRLTNSILYPKEAYSFKYSSSPPNLLLEVHETSARGQFSYEDFEELVDVYDRIYSDYMQLGIDLGSFAGDLEEYLPGTTIREKWDVVLTKEDVLTEVGLTVDNSKILEEEINLRKDVLSYDYGTKIEEAKERIGIQEEGQKALCGPTIILLLALLVALIIIKSPKAFPLLALVGIVFAVLPTPTLSQGGFEIPTIEEVISQKITNASLVQIEIQATGIGTEKAREIITGFPLLLEGEGVIVRGPYYYDGQPNYLFDITRDETPTGYLILVDGVQLRLVGSQRKAFQLQKTRFMADMIKSRPLYSNADADAIKAESEKGLGPPLDLFLANISENIKAGKELEKTFTEKPDFATLRELTKNYIQGFVLLNNIERASSPEEAKTLTHGFSENVLWLEAYGRAARGLSADEYLAARMGQYRGRTLNRIPLMMQLKGMEMLPSKAQVVHDLASDLLYDNIFIWHLEKITDPALFARLSYKEGTFTIPRIFNVTTNTTEK